jgi:hypothetical protein
MQRGKFKVDAWIELPEPVEDYKSSSSAFGMGYSREPIYLFKNRLILQLADVFTGKFFS